MAASPKPYEVGFSLGQGCLRVNPVLDTSSSAALEARARHYAPRIFQDAAPDTSATRYRADFITAFNFDGNWSGADNWQNMDGRSLPAYVYWSGVETESHCFLAYYLFHPRDWGEKQLSWPECMHDEAKADPAERLFGNGGACHENDLEGLAIAVSKASGVIQGMAVVYHNDFNTCTPGGTGGPPVYAETRGHALNCARSESPDSYPFDDGDGVVYRYGPSAQEPANGNDRDVSYQLLHTKELHDQLTSPERDQMFAEGGCKFRGDDYVDNAASTPWCLEPGLVARVPGSALSGQPGAAWSAVPYVGSLYADPARLFASLFPTYTYSSAYLYNPNLSARAEYAPDAPGVAASALGEVSVYLPAGALSEAASITVTYQMPAGLAGSVRLDGTERLLASRPFALEVRTASGQLVTSFAAPAELEAAFSPALLSEKGLDASRLTIMAWQDGAWQVLATGVVSSTRVARAATSAPGVFGLFAGRLPTYDLYLPLVVRR